jgi:hypothetical protein
MAKAKIVKILDMTKKAINDTYCSPKADCGFASLVIRNRKASKTDIGVIDLNKLPAVEGMNREELADYHLDVKITAAHSFALLCFTHKHAHPVVYRGQATKGGFNVSSGVYAGMTAFHKANTKGLLIGWCPSCVKARKAAAV